MIRKAVAVGLIDAAEIYTELEDFEASISTYNEIESQFGKDTFFGTREVVVRAQQQRIILLSKIEQRDRAIEECDIFLQRHLADSSDPVLQENLAWFLSQKGALLADKGDFEKAVDVFDEVEQRFGANSDMGCRLSTALSLRVKAGCLFALNREDEGLMTRYLLLEKFGNDPISAIRWYAENSLYFSDDD